MPVVQTAVCLGMEDIFRDPPGRVIQKKALLEMLHCICFVLTASFQWEGTLFMDSSFTQSSCRTQASKDSPEGGEDHSLPRLFPSVLPAGPQGGCWLGPLLDVPLNTAIAGLLTAELLPTPFPSLALSSRTILCCSVKEFVTSDPRLTL